MQDNILITSVGERKMIRYIDFGLAVETEPGSQITNGKLIGTPGYMAPEIEARQPYSCNADVWSLGVVFFQASLLVAMSGTHKNHLII